MINIQGLVLLILSYNYYLGYIENIEQESEFEPREEFRLIHETIHQSIFKTSIKLQNLH